MNEGTLKTKWRKHAKKQGFETKSLSPHQIPGLPDIIAVDKSSSTIIREYKRVRVHLIEAKVFQDRPKCFDAARDATPKQVEWIVTWAKMGVPTWWLILGPAKWLLVGGETLQVKRDVFRKKAKKYGDRITPLCEPEHNRHVLAGAMDEVLDRQRLKIAEMFNGG